MKWTAPEVYKLSKKEICEHQRYTYVSNRHSITRNTQLLVMCGAMELSCMKYGVWDTSHLKE